MVTPPGPWTIALNQHSNKINNMEKQVHAYDNINQHLYLENISTDPMSTLLYISRRQKISAFIRCLVNETVLW